MTLDRPDKLHLTHTGGFANVEMVFDGKTLTLWGKNSNLYTELEAPPMPAMYWQERTYPSLLGPLGDQCSVWAECVFVDPIADIAVLGQPES